MTFPLKDGVQYVQDDDGTGSTFLQSFCHPAAEPLPFYCTEWVVSHYLNKRTNSLLCLPHILKGTVPWGFRHQNFFINQFPPKPLSLPLGLFRIFTSVKFATGINNTSGTGGKICHRCRWYRWCTLTCEYLREFAKNFEMALMLFSGAWTKMIHERNLKQKVSWHCPFKYNIYYFAGSLTSMRLILRSRSIVTLT
jgi:hypothetical protein